MIEVIEYEEKYKSAWNEYVKVSTRSTISHLIEWKDIIRDGIGHTPKYFLAIENGTIRGIIPLFLVSAWFKKKYLISIPWLDYGGVCADNLDVEMMILERIKELTKELQALFLELRAVESADTDLPLRKDKVTFLLKLEKDPDINWNNFNGKLRNQIRKSDKSELRVEFGGRDKLDSFYKVFCRNMRDLGTPVWGKNLFENILKDLDGQSEIVLVKKNDRTIAGGLVLSFKDRLYVPSASAYRDSLKYCPNHALYWAVIKKACETGCSYFDFGRSSWNSNTFNFKKQWTPDPVQLNWQYYLPDTEELPELNPSNPKFRLAINLWKKLPLPIANILGPKIIKNFP